MELRCTFVVVLVHLVAVHGYGVKGGGAVAKAESSAAATSGIGEVPLSIPPAGGFSSSFSKSSSSSFASSSASSSSSSFSYSSSGAGGFAGANGIALSGKGDCISGKCQDQANGGVNELNGSDATINELKAYSGSAAGAKAFSTSSGYSQNAGQIPCTGHECLNQDLTGAKSSSISGSSAFAQNGDQTPCIGENCSNQASPLNGAKTSSFSGSEAYAQNQGKSPCSGENCSQKSNNFNNCASGSCGTQLLTGPLSYAYESKEKPFNANQGTKTVIQSNDDDSSMATLNSKPPNVYGSKDVFNNDKQVQVIDTTHGSSDQSTKYEKASTGHGSAAACTRGDCDSPLPYPQSKSTETSYPLGSYSTESPKCISGNCDHDSTKFQYPSSTVGASFSIPATYLTTPKETGIPESPCTAPGCQSPEVNDYPGSQNRPSSYNVPIYTDETKIPTATPQEKDVTCISANCKNNYPYTDYTPNHSNTLTAPSKIIKDTITGVECTSSNCDTSTTDIKVPKSPSTSNTVPHSSPVSGTTSTCLTGNCASDSIPQVFSENVDAHEPTKPKLPPYLAALPSHPDKLKPPPSLGGLSNCEAGNCASYPSFSNIGVGAGNSGSFSQIPYKPTGHINPTNCAGSNCASYPTYENNQQLPIKKPSYFFTTPSFSNAPSSSQPPKYLITSNTPVVSSKNPFYSHGSSQPSYQNQFPVSGPFQTGTSSLQSHISSSTQGISGSHQKDSVYTGSYGGPSGLLAPNDYTIPTKPLSSQQRPPVKPNYPYDGSLTPTSSTPNIPVSTSHKVTCATGNCGTQPSLSTSNYGQITSANVASATTNSETEYKVSNSPSYSQPPKYSNTPYPIYQVPVVDSKNPSSTHEVSQPSYQNQLPTSGPFQTGTSSLTNHISSSTQGISGSNQKGSLYTGGFGGPSGLLAPSDYTIPAKPLSSQQSPSVNSINLHASSLAPPSSTANVPVSTSHKVTCASGNCDTQPTPPTSHYGQITSTSVASSTANAETGSKGVLYTGGFGGPPGILAPYNGNKGNFGHSGVIAKPAPVSTSKNGPHTGNIHSSYSGFPNAASTKPNTDASSGYNSFTNGYKSQENSGNSLHASNSGLSNSSPSYEDSSHNSFGNAYGIFKPSQQNLFTNGQPNTLPSNTVSGSGSQTIAGSQGSAAASANSAAFSASKTQEGGNVNKIPSVCSNGDCSSQRGVSHYGGSNGGFDFSNSENSPNLGTGVIAGAQSGAFSGFFGDDQLKSGCGGGCSSNGAHSGEGNGLYGTAAIAKSTATATSGAGAGVDQFGLSKSFASSVATAHASSGAAVKGSYGRR